jgi:hypothetical protein
MDADFLTGSPNDGRSVVEGAHGLSTLHVRLGLPPELIDIIIELLHDDRAALAICALVCRSWVPASRSHLFSKIDITPQNWKVASELLSSATCTIAFAVKELTLSAIDALSDLHDITRRLYNVALLWLHNSNLTNGQEYPRRALVPLLQNLKRLCLVSVIFDEDVLLWLLHHSSLLESFSSYYGSIKALIGDIPQPLVVDRRAQAPSLTSLEVYRCNESFFSTVAHWAGTAPQLTTLHMETLESDDPSVAGSAASLLQAVGPNLEVLRLFVGPDNICE